MASCYRCSAETQLYDNGMPVCLSCADAPVPIKPNWEITLLPNDTQLGLPHD
jgi:hypothetical protein